MSSALEYLFKTVHDLKQITLCHARDGLLDPQGLEETRKSPKMLDLSAADEGSVHSASDLECLISNCSRLGRLCLNIADFAQAVNGLE
jgi:hypothetical protein